MKEQSLKKLLKVISEAADNIIEGKTCWYGKEAVEAGLMEMLAFNFHHVFEDNGFDVEPWIPKPKTLKKRVVGGRA